MREKPRDLTGPFENPVRRWVRLREKARLFCELPPPQRVPVAKPARRSIIKDVEGVPKVSPKALELRLEFLLGDNAIMQQLSEPLVPGTSPRDAEMVCWERQMRDLRRIYRAQYLQKLAEVTEIERQKELELRRRVIEERQRRKQAHLQRIGEDMKRRAILADRKAIEYKVTEAIEMTRRSKVKRQKLFWLRRIEKLSPLIVTQENVDKALPNNVSERPSAEQSKSQVLLSRNVSVPLLLRQLGGAKGKPQQKKYRIPRVDNVQRDLLESSYDILPEDEPRFEPVPPNHPTARERAHQLYGVFSPAEKQQLLDQKIQMLDEAIRTQDSAWKADANIIRLKEALSVIKTASNEPSTEKRLKEHARESRGKDPERLDINVKKSVLDGD